jgi:hypothetical protein
VGKPNPYTWEIVDKALSEAGAIVALLTTDDEARLRPDLWSKHENPLEKEYELQPRQMSSSRRVSLMGETHSARFLSEWVRTGQ